MARNRRGRGEGSIFQRKDGLWVGSVSAGYDGIGRRQRRVVYGETKKEVQDKLGEALNDISSGAPVRPNKITIKQFVEDWIDNAGKLGISHSTYVRYKSIVKNQIVPFLGNHLVAQLELIHVEKFYADMAKAECSNRTMELTGIVLGRAMKRAVKLQILRQNPVREVQKPKGEHREMKVWNQAEVAKFRKAYSGDRLEAMYALALGSGMRQGELFGLAWSDIDLKGSRLTVQRMLDETRGTFTLKEPKTGKGRQIDLPKFVVKALRAHQAKMLAEGNIAAKSVFCDEKGGWLRKSNVTRRSFKPLVKAAGVPEIRFHDMRHTHATLLLLAGENVKVVSERLGHASIQITLDTYSHVLPSMGKAAADKIQKLLG